jgi:phage-related protein
MAKLSTTLSLIDGFSNKLNAINSSLQRSGDSMGRFRSQVEKPVGSRMFDGFKAGLSSADSAVSSFSSSFAAKMGVISGITQAITTKAINVLSSGVREMVGELSSASATWQTFQGNMEMIGKSGDEIKQVKGE